MDDTNVEAAADTASQPEPQSTLAAQVELAELEAATAGPDADDSW